MCFSTSRTLRTLKFCMKPIGRRILTSSTRPNPPTPSVARNVISLSSSSAISLGIFRDTVPIFAKFSEDGASL